MSVFLLCCGAWIRTRIYGFKGRCPTIRRSRKIKYPALRILLKNGLKVKPELFYTLAYFLTASQLAIILINKTAKT